MIVAVLDSSVLVSAFLTPGGTSAMLLSRAKQGTFSIHLSREIVDETGRALLRPKIMQRYGHTADEVAQYQVLLIELAKVEQDLPDLRAVARDPKDDVVVATALAAGAGFLITGDDDILVLGEYGGVRIVTPRAFLALL